MGAVHLGVACPIFGFLGVYTHQKLTVMSFDVLPSSPAKGSADRDCYPNLAPQRLGHSWHWERVTTQDGPGFSEGAMWVETKNKGGK